MYFLPAFYHNKKLLFLVFWIITLCIYAPAWNACFIADFMDAVYLFREGSFAEFVNRETADVISLYQVTQLELYLLLSVFGLHPLPWFLLFTILHAVNGVLVTLFFSRLFRNFDLRNGDWIAFCGTLLFLFNPNITEVTIWKGGFHYLTAVLMQLLILLWCQRYLTGGRSRLAWFAAILFALSTYTLELFYATPFLSLFLVLGYRMKGLLPPERFKTALLYFILPQVALFLLHLVTFRVMHGGWIAHYGTTSDFVWSLPEIVSAYGKYLSYLSVHAGHWPFHYREVIYGWFKNPVISWALLGALPAFIIITLARFKKATPAQQLTVFLLGGLLCSLTLVATTYFDELFSLYNSRRAYHAGIFLYMILVVILFSLRSTRLANGLFLAYFFVAVFFTVKKVIDWRRATTIQQTILKNFDRQAFSPVLLLNIPSYYRDIRIIPANEPNEFNDQLQAFGRTPAKGKVYTVSSYNMQHGYDGAHVTVLDSTTIKVTLNQWGCWWMYNYQGAANYENELYRVEFTDPGHEYILHLKKPVNGADILFQRGLEWRSVDLAKPGREQWY